MKQPLSSIFLAKPCDVYLHLRVYQFKKLDAAYHEAFEKGIGIHGSSYTNTMMVELGETLHFAAGSDKNIKLTTKDDLEMFKGYMKMDKDTWLK